MIRWLLIACVGLNAGCVSMKKWEQAQAEIARLTKQNDHLQKTVQSLEAEVRNVQTHVETLENAVESLKADTTHWGRRFRTLLSEWKQLNQLYDQQVQQNKMLLAQSTVERRSLVDSLVRRQRELQQKERMLDSVQRNLMLRERKLSELTALLNQKDSLANALRTSIQRALMGFEKSDLSVELKDGKVYVSLSEKLLFQSGRTDVDAKGRAALVQLAGVLKKNPDISITVEGHTDNVPLAGTGFMKDNWDLSVLRATSIVRILTENGVDHRQIIASGRGEYFPVATNSTAEGRARNRRTEIILTARLEELAKIIGSY